MIVPQAVYQYLIAKHVARLRVGKELFPRSLTADEIRRSAEEILDHPADRQAATRIGASLRTTGRVPEAADLIEQILR